MTMIKLIRSALVALVLLGTVRANAQATDAADEAPPSVEPPSVVPPSDAPSAEKPADAPQASPAVAPASPAHVLEAGPTDLSRMRLMPDDRWIRLGSAVEFGALSVVTHTIQFGREGTELDYVKEGGQDNLFPFARASLEATLWQQHTFVALYQPLTIETDAVLDRDLQVYDEVFSAGTPMKLKYGFDFVRFSYFYDFLPEVSEELGIGLSLQLRDAVIGFASADGKQLVSNSGLGPVPILKARFRHQLDNGFFYAAEADGFWASGRIITGTANDFEGAIADVSLRAGAPVTGFANVFANFRYIGGGARGVEEQEGRSGDGFANNWLQTVIVSMGLELR